MQTAEDAPSPSTPSVPEGKRYDKVALVEPNGRGYITLATEVDSRPPWLPPSAAKQALVEQLKQRCGELEKQPQVERARVFVARLIPPGKGAYLRQRPHIHVARFDVVVLVVTRDVEAAQELRDNPAFASMQRRLQQDATRTHAVVSRNARRIGEVDHDRDGVFLFNFFTADDVTENLHVWEYTAG